MTSPLPVTQVVAQLDPNAESTSQTGATVQSTHEMLVALAILSAVGMLLVIIAGISDDAADAVLLIVGALLLVQAVTHVNPFVAFLADHPLTPVQAGISNGQKI